MDQKAYEELYNHHYLSVFRFARKFVDNRAAAEDITTDVFMKLWNKRAGFKDHSGVRSFFVPCIVIRAVLWLVIPGGVFIYVALAAAKYSFIKAVYNLLLVTFSRI